MFDGGRVTSDGGLCLVEAVDGRMVLTEALGRCLRDLRQAGKVRHGKEEMLRQRLYPIAAGYEDCNDSDFLRSDPCVKLSVGRLPEAEEDLLQPQGPRPAPPVLLDMPPDERLQSAQRGGCEAP